MRGWILAALTLILLALPAIRSADAEADDDAKGDTEAAMVERAIALADLPEAVRAVVLKEAGDHELVELEEVCPEGKEDCFYEAVWIEGDLEVEIAVSPEGAILARESEPRDSEGED